MICLKIRTFVVSATTVRPDGSRSLQLWFAWKFVPLWYQQQPLTGLELTTSSCDLLENSYLCGISNNTFEFGVAKLALWFAWKFVPLWYQQQLLLSKHPLLSRCDLLENSYLCGISNNKSSGYTYIAPVVICLKIRTFVVSATTAIRTAQSDRMLWFAWKFVPLWYQQQLLSRNQCIECCCDLLENSYLCGISNNQLLTHLQAQGVVICLKIRTFVVSATTIYKSFIIWQRLWFAWKFVPLWYQQQLGLGVKIGIPSCDLLENSYLCGISNNTRVVRIAVVIVVICLKIRTFVVSATTLLVK